MATKAASAAKAAVNTEDKPKPGQEVATQKREVVDSVSGDIVDEDEAFAGYAEDAGQGFENQTQDDVGIPYIVLMQPLSPEVMAEGSEVKPGMWVNRGTGVASETIDFVPALTRHVFREWSSKEPTNSAPVGDHEIDSDLIAKVRNTQQFGQYTHPDNPEHPLVETFEVYGLQITNEGAAIPAVVTFSSTMIRPYKDWQMRARSIIINAGGRKINPPLFSHVYRLDSTRVDKKPHVWWIPKVGFAGAGGAEESRLLPNSDIYSMAKALKEAVLSGATKAAAPPRGDGPGEAGHSEKASADQEKAPY